MTDHANAPLRARLRWISPWPLGWTTVLFPGAVIALLSWIGGRYITDQRYGIWVTTSAQFHESLTFAGPVAAAAGCFFGARLAARRSLLSLPISARTGLHTAVRHIIVVSAYCILGYVLGLIPVLVFTLRSATAGSLDVPVAATGIVAIMLAVAIGYAIGVAAKSIFVVPLSALVVFLLLQFPNLLSSGWAGAIPVQMIIPDAGQYENPTVVTYRIFFEIAAILAMVVVAGIIVHARPHYGRTFPVVAAVVVPLAILVVPVWYTPNLFSVETDAPMICRHTDQGVQVCVHAAHETDLAALTDTADVIFSSYGSIPGHAHAVYDRALGYSIPADRHGVLAVTVDPGPPSQSLGAQEIAFVLAGRTACSPSSGDPETDEARVKFSDALSSWLSADSGTATPGSSDTDAATVGDGPSLPSAESGDSTQDAVAMGMVDDKLTAHGRSDIQQFIVGHASAIASCSATLDQLDDAFPVGR